MLADFVPYDAPAWQSLYARYMAQTWGVSLSLAAALLLSVVVLWRQWPAMQRYCQACVIIALAACWAWLGWQFHGQWHRQLNWAAPYWSAAFLVQAALLGLAAMGVLNAPARPATMARPSPAHRHKTAIAGLLLLPWVIPPLAGWMLADRPAAAWEFVGAAPDPTAWFSILVMLSPVSSINAAWRGKMVNRLLLLIPLASLTVGAAAAWVTHATDLLAIQLVAATSIVGMVGAGKTVRRGRSPSAGPD